MKRTFLIVILLALALSACSGGGVYDSAYTAAGDGSHPDELDRTQQFRPNDDLNVIVNLNPHDNDVEVRAIFYDPNGNQIGNALSIVAGENVGRVTLGLDWEAREGEQAGEQWPSGAWEVVVEVDGEEVESLAFRVS